MARRNGTSVDRINRIMGTISQTENVQRAIAVLTTKPRGYKRCPSCESLVKGYRSLNCSCGHYFESAKSDKYVTRYTTGQMVPKAVAQAFNAPKTIIAPTTPNKARIVQLHANIADMLAKIAAYTAELSQLTV